MFWDKQGFEKRRDNHAYKKSKLSTLIKNRPNILEHGVEIIQAKPFDASVEELVCLYLPYEYNMITKDVDF